MRELMERIRQARDWCIQQGMQLEILPGCEIFYTPQTVRMLRDGLIPTLAESEFVLVEFLPGAPYSELIGADRAVQGIAERGESVDCSRLYARFCAHRALQMSALAGARSEVEA